MGLLRYQLKQKIISWFGGSPPFFLALRNAAFMYNPVNGILSKTLGITRKTEKFLGKGDSNLSPRREINDPYCFFLFSTTNQ